MTCDNCGHTRFHDERVTRTFVVEGKVIMVEDVPAQVCDRCEDASFSASVAERLRTIVHQPHPNARSIPAELLRFEAA